MDTAGWQQLHLVPSHTLAHIWSPQAIFAKSRNRGKKQKPWERQQCGQGLGWVRQSRGREVTLGICCPCCRTCSMTVFLFPSFIVALNHAICSSWIPAQWFRLGITAHPTVSGRCSCPLRLGAEGGSKCTLITVSPCLWRAGFPLLEVFGHKHAPHSSLVPIHLPQASPPVSDHASLHHLWFLL